MLRRLIWLTDRLIDLSALTGAAGLVVALGVTATEVVTRAYGAPLYGARDIVSMAGVFVVFGGMALAHKNGAHIAVDLLERHFSTRMNHWLTAAAHLLGAAVFALIAWQLWVAVPLARMLNSATNLLYLPRWPFLVAMMGLCLICMLSMLLRGVQHLTERPAR
ncbi:MAG: TRAP transporter small permease [Gemmobacter sp.]|jgi:TRAP-type C4-dicarboxylate transport system permease small subunit|nr:TRAP transporter small permease [Gemmobacter sp.]